MKYQLLPELDPAEFEALKADILRNGVLVPVEIDEAGDLLDGHHRVRAWEELKAEGHDLEDYPFILRPGMTEAQKRNHARRLNIQRRHLTSDQKAEIARAFVEDRGTDDGIRSAIREAAELTGLSERRVEQVTADIRQEEKEQRNQRIQELADLGWSQRDIADEVGVGIATVNRSVPKSKDFDFGTPLPGIMGHGKADYRNAKRVASHAVGTTTLAAAKAAAKEDRIARRKKEIARAAAGIQQDGNQGKVTLYHGDFRELGKTMEDASVDLILTDPPYPEEFLPLWEDMAMLALRILRPGGYLVAYSGQRFLPEIYAMLGRNLDYQWTAAVKHSSGYHRIHMHDLLNAWKPILIYSNGKPSVGMRGLQDFITGGKGDKDAHHWAQPEAEARQLIDAFSTTGQTVFDPFMGSGTIPAAAYRMGRLAIGSELEQEFFDAAKVAIYGKG